MKSSINKMLVTCAFPYANGDIHLGHLLEQIQADIWVRYFRMKNRSVIFICSDDTHGTAIMLQAKKLQISPDQLIHDVQKKHEKDFLQFSIVHDNYSSTHSVTNKNFCIKIYNHLLKKNFIKEKKIIQLYDTHFKMFLSDRFIKGTCPQCKSKNQYGDNCDVCGSIYDATELLNATSELSHAPLKKKSSNHLFFKLSSFSNFLKKWVNSDVLQVSVFNKINEWLSGNLNSWNISRDKPYFGFLIPNYTDKFFYVWMDAPIGYISCFKELCDMNQDINFDDYWSINSKHELYHFIGKDIIYFHALFWPAILEGYGYRKPTKIFAHGYLTFKGLKLSKSKGSMITASKWLSCFDSDSLRYYFSSKLSDTIQDIEMNLYDYARKINSDIVNSIINLASRNASFLEKYFYNVLSNDIIITSTVYKKFINSSLDIEKLFENRKFSLVVQKIRYLSDLANKYITDKKPWILIKNVFNKQKVHKICSLGINLFRILIIFLKPIMPILASNVECFLNTSLVWKNIREPLMNHKINKFSCLYKRIKMSSIDDFLSQI
ncbi:methionine--tRNA ligase [Buchnera aphidicola]|uniref:Methionine--tRNA ligase n=1 Tax=Buchnera aphidicola (Cinara cf. splendens/pseudotsugae 3390) TaxID=2518980 RepID=A0A451CX30_9GAMM|nr:methionine--tRNA ligase [Buchnera aphidicola]VFP77649.1 Methionine--tRNA ligase [Buchnera aphidicola (Cinara cf. splendens/pseudotsugae 3390)]